MVSYYSIQNFAVQSSHTVGRYLGERRGLLSQHTRDSGSAFTRLVLASPSLPPSEDEEEEDEEDDDDDDDDEDEEEEVVVEERSPLESLAQFERYFRFLGFQRAERIQISKA